MARNRSSSSRLTDPVVLRNIWQGPISKNMLTMFVISIFIGIVAGLGAVAFRRLIGFVHNLFFYGTFSFDYPMITHTAPSIWGPLIILSPIVGGMIVVFLVLKFAPEAKGHGVPEVMGAINYQKGVIRPQVVFVKALASAINIGSGASVGREGPIIQIGSAFAANLARWLNLAEWQRYTMIAAGAGAGIAATFNTPAGGVLFAVELMLPEIGPRTVMPVMVATGMATYISRLFLGTDPSFLIPALTIAGTGRNNLEGFVAFVILGVLIGLLALAFMRAIYQFEDWFDAMPGNAYTRHAIGMLAVGIIFYTMFVITGHYYVQGVGYATVQDILTGTLSLPGLMLVLLVLKLLATSLTLGSGGSGGIFSPSLFLGATLGGAFAVIANQLIPGLHLDVTTAAAAGMAAMVGAGAGAVLTGVVMISEMTHDINVLMPLIITSAVAFGVRRMITVETIYTLKLTRRGQPIPESRHSNLYLLRQAREFVRRPFLRIGADATLDDLRGFVPRIGPTPHVLLTEDGKAVGVIPAKRVDALMAGTDTAAMNQLRDRAGTNFEIMPDRVTIVDVLARRLATHGELYVFTETGADTDAVTGVVTWDNIVEDAKLPRMLYATMGTRDRAAASTTAIPRDGSVAELQVEGS